MTLTGLAFKEEIKTFALTGRLQWSTLVAIAKEVSIADGPEAAFETGEKPLVDISFKAH